MAAPDTSPPSAGSLRQVFRNMVPRPVRAALHAAVIAPTRWPGFLVRQARRARWKWDELMSPTRQPGLFFWHVSRAPARLLDTVGARFGAFERQNAKASALREARRIKRDAWIKSKRTQSRSAANYWSNHSGYSDNWYQFCAPYINERVTGDPGKALTPWALSITGKADQLLEVGCLDGKKLSGLVKAGLASHGSGLDIAAGAIERGRELHPELELFVGDLNKPELPVEAYDVILANGVLHHIENIDVCVNALHAALKPGGWLISNDFTGPRRYVYSDAEIALIREGQAMLPKELRGAPFHPDQLASKLAYDPSESITTTTIVPTLRGVFADVTEHRFGGNVLMRALTKTFFENFDAENPAHIEAIERLQEFDRVNSQDYSHHTYCLSRKRAA